MKILSIFSKQLKSDDVNRWLAFGIIALAVLVFYFPVLFYPPRSDQVIYLAQTAHQQHPLDLILGNYDYNRHRIFAPGDELLFRPLVFMFLGGEQVLFGHHFWAWQLVGLIAHLTLVWVLLRLLWHLSSPWLAFAGTWIFALSAVNYELVSWTHISSYMLMMACIVCVIEQTVFCFEDAQVPWGRIKRILIYSLIACFTYETANIFVLWVAGALIISFPKMKGRLALLVMPVILYGSLSYLNYVYLNPVTHYPPGMANGMPIRNYGLVIVYLTLWWLYEGLFNGMYQYVLALRTMFPTDEVTVFKPLVLNNLQVILELIMLSAFCGLAWINRRQFFKRIRPAILLLGMLFSYVTVIVVGRNSEMGNLFEAVRINTYFTYIFWVLIAVIVFLFLSDKGKKTKLQQWLIMIFVMASIFSGLWQGRQVHHMASRYSRDTNDNILLVTTLDLLIQEKKLEPNFSFYVDRTYPGNYSYGPTIHKETDPPDREYTFAELLYPQYFRPKALAKYKFLVKKAK